MSTETADPIPAIQMPDPSCSTCKWGAKAKGSPHYECRRYPPQLTSFPVPVQGPPRIGMPGVVQMQVQDRAAFPTVRSDSLCGEYQPSFGRGH
jgi:hypothetical protein